MDLFTPPTRDERQTMAISAWTKSGGKATIVAGTGFGKTFMAIRTIKSLRKKYTSAKVLVIVPTDLLKNQWKEELFKNGVPDVDVQVMNGASKREYTCDLLIIDKHLSM